VSSSEINQQLADLVVGARGWIHEHWMDSYYPDDIPDEWRLGFYANEFNTLLVPWEQWSESVEELTEGLEDTADDFHLYLELPDNVQSLPAHFETIADEVTALVCVSGAVEDWQQQAADLNTVLLSALPKENAVFQGFFELASDQPMRLVLVDSSAGLDDLALMREQLELALSFADTRLDFIFIDKAPALDAMRNTQMIAELLGA